MKDNKDLRTTFCHKCGLWMEFPYEKDNKLYHQWCLPHSTLDTLKNNEKDILNEPFNPMIDEAIQQQW